MKELANNINTSWKQLPNWHRVLTGRISIILTLEGTRMPANTDLEDIHRHIIQQLNFMLEELNETSK